MIWRRRRRALKTLDLEFDDYLDREAAENIERGMDSQTARYAALRSFGNVTRLKEDTRAVWSLLDQKGTQAMMKSVLGEASQLADYDTVKNRMRSSRYTMDFANGVKFNMAVVMSDTMTAATAATLMKGMAILKKTGGSPLEKTAMDDTTIESNSGTLTVEYSSSDSQFANLLTSPLFQQVVK